MVSKPSRESRYTSAEDRKAAEEIAKNPPILVWETVPGSGGIRVARLVKDPHGKPGRRPKPPCDCELYGKAKERHGHHHDEGCARREPR